MNARPNCPPYSLISHRCTFKILPIGWNVTTCLKKSKAELPRSVYGKYVTGVGRGHEMIETSKIPMMMAPLTRYICRITTRIPLSMIPSHMVPLRIFWEDGQRPVSTSLYSGAHPASSTGVAVAPTIRPIPAEYVRPMIVRYRPMPTPVASLIL